MEYANMTLSGNVVFSSGKLGDYDLFSLNLANSELIQLTCGKGINDCPCWSPDGKQILFLSDRSGTPQVWRMDEDGSNPERITQQDKWHGAASWSPDGGSITFSANYAGFSNIYTLRMDSHELCQITDEKSSDTAPRFSPDGKRITFNSFRSGNPDIWSIELESGILRQLTDYKGRDFGPSYSPDGRHIAYVSGVLDAKNNENLDIFIMDSNGSDKYKVTHNKGSDRFVAWSPCGDYLLYSASEPGEVADRLQILDLNQSKSYWIDLDRSLIEKEIDAEVEPFGLFTLMPKNIIRKYFYKEEQFGSEHHPDWKYEAVA